MPRHVKFHALPTSLSTDASLADELSQPAQPFSELNMRSSNTSRPPPGASRLHAWPVFA
jgi:hypothetical protein